MAVTHGCIRMYPEDIEALFKIVPVGTKVWLINEPVKVAYVNGELLLEAHPQIDAEGQPMEPDLDMLSLRLDHALGSTTAAINWDLARETLQSAQGMPTLVGLEADLDSPADSAPATSAQSIPAVGAPPMPAPGPAPMTMPPPGPPTTTMPAPPASAGPPASEGSATPMAAPNPAAPAISAPPTASDPRP
jgi:L,D-transpeptidase ErfK/SrfK